MKKLLNLMLATTVFSTAWASDNAFKVESNIVFAGQSDTPYKIIKMTSREDDIEVKDVITNRGNCQVFAKTKDEWSKVNPQVISVMQMASMFSNTTLIVELPFKMKYGQSQTFSTGNCSDLLEIKFITDKGDFTYSF